MGDWQPFGHLSSYLLHSGWIAAVQFALFTAIVCVLADRGLRATGRCGASLADGERITSKMLDQMTCACMGMGLLLTFSGLYTYIGANQQQDRWPLLLALGSSALGYGAWTIFAFVGVLDEWREASGSPREIERGAGWEHHRTGRRDDESQFVADTGRGRGHLGGVVPGPIATPATGLGGLGGFAVDQPLDGRVDGVGTLDDLGHSRFDGDLAGSIAGTDNPGD